MKKLKDSAIGLLVAALKQSSNPDNSAAIRDAFYKVKNYERALGPAGSKGGYVEGRNHLLEAKDMLFSVVRGGLETVK